MKIYREEIAGTGKKRILFALGIDKVKLVYGVMQKAWIHFPYGPKWKPTGRRMWNIITALKKFLEQNKPEKLQEKQMDNGPHFAKEDDMPKFTKENLEKTYSKENIDSAVECIRKGKIAREEYSVRRQIKEWWESWIMGYYLANDAFDMSLRKSVALGELETLIQKREREIVKGFISAFSEAFGKGSSVDPLEFMGIYFQQREKEEK